MRIERIEATCCRLCGHPVPAEGITIPAGEDYDRSGAGRERCADISCDSDAVCTVEGGVPVPVVAP